MYENIFKRLLDLIFVAIAITILLPIYLLLFILIYLGDFHSPIFRQKRVGREKKIFTLYKFRSMPVNTGDMPSSEVSKIKNTKIGKFIRRTNLDELPQFINILIGDMSLVGPRPNLCSQKKLITLRDKNNSYNCKPGLSGLAQVNSFDGMPDEKKAYWDGLYSKNITFMNDVKIFFKTLIYITKKPPTY